MAEKNVDVEKFGVRFRLPSGRSSTLSRRHSVPATATHYSEVKEVASGTEDDYNSSSGMSDCKQTDGSESEYWTNGSKGSTGFEVELDENGNASGFTTDTDDEIFKIAVALRQEALKPKPPIERPANWWRLRDPNVEPDLRFQKPPTPIPVKSICLATFLCLAGTALLLFGFLVLTGHVNDKYDDRVWPMAIIGLLMFIPGAYHCRIAYLAYYGVPGYSFDDIPEFE